ncbi:MAG: YolD-like family protein [Candidatus Izimaplasma sp.]|nr:YolD-like family protein [Candidatus Izimaplasma bacterium]
MPSRYIDRGIIKWAPFNALNGYSTMLKEMKFRTRKNKKPILSDDEYQTLNLNIQQAIRENLEVEIEYYENGYIKYGFGKIKKLDFIHKLLILSTNEKIPAIDVLSLEIAS